MTKVKPAEARPRPWEREDRGGSFGSWLRQQREVRGVSLREIADVSRISLRYLEALEQDRFDVLPAPVFARGFLREYARFVGLDPDQVVNDFTIAQQASEPTLIAEPQRPRSRSLGTSPWGYGVFLTLVVLLFLGIAAVLSFYAGRRHATAPPGATPPPLVAPPAQTAPRTPQPATPALPSGAVAAPTPATPVATTMTGPSAPVERNAEPGPGMPAAAAPLHLTLDFTQDCWVRVQIDGNRWYSKQYAAGETLALDAQKEAVLSLGNAAGVSLLVNGKAWPLPPGERNVLKDLRIDLGSVGAAAAPPGPS